MSVAELIALQKSQNAVRLTFRKQQSKRQSSIDVASSGTKVACEFVTG
jgi:hypothetical protein